MNIFNCFRKEKGYSAKEAHNAAVADRIVSFETALRIIKERAEGGDFWVYIGALTSDSVTRLKELGYKIEERDVGSKDFPEYVISWEHI